MSNDSTANTQVHDAPQSRRSCPWCGAPATGAGTRCGNCERELADTRIGMIVASRYRIEALLGQGGMGRVYRAVHTEIGEPLALKFLLAEWAARPEARARFKREAVALARLRHPSIVQVIDFGEDAGLPFLVMELIQGESLDRQVVRDGKTLGVARSVWIMDSVLQVLESAHAAGIVHRDLKPANVMLFETADRVERIKVLDFGLALIDDRGGADRLTGVDSIRGTPMYMSPEQCRGRDVGPPTDIYACACMLYELLAGDTPFGGESSTDVMAQHVYSKPPPIATRGIRETVPPGLEAIVMRGLAKKAEDRPSAPELRAELALALRGDDEASRAHREAEQRVKSATQTRDQRALAPARAWVEPGEGSKTVSARRTAVSPRVAVEGIADGLATTLRDSLAVTAGIDAVQWSEAGADSNTGGGSIRVIVLGGGVAAAARVQALRKAEATSAIPTLVLDVASPQQTATLIRAGASDVATANVDVDAIVQKILRLVRRGR